MHHIVNHTIDLKLYVAAYLKIDSWLNVSRRIFMPFIESAVKDIVYNR